MVSSDQTGVDTNGQAGKGTAVRLSPGEAARLAARHFGIQGETRELGSNEDQNFLISAVDGPVVFKVTSSATPASDLEVQNLALLHLAQGLTASGIVSPHVYPSLDGSGVVPVRLQGRDVTLRVLGFVAGNTAMFDLAKSGTSMCETTAAGLGRAAGLIVRGLSDLHPQTEVRNRRWDLRAGGAFVRESLTRLPLSMRELVRDIVYRVEERIDPASLPTQMIHGDVTDDNVIVDEGGNVIGVIDFGDLAQGWRIAELAVTVAALLRYGHRSPALVRAAIRAFDEVSPLEEGEIVALWPLVTLRTAVLAASGADIAARDPDNGYASARRPFEKAMLEGALALELDEAELLIRQWLNRFPTGEVSGRLIASDVPNAGILDLSIWSQLNDAGRWQDHAHATEVLTEAWCRHGASSTRFGEHRLRSDGRPGWRGSRSLALGIDLALTASTPILSPGTGVIAANREGHIQLRLEGGLSLHLAGVDSEVSPGDTLTAGEELGRATSHGPNPAIVHVQLCRHPDIVPPAFVVPGDDAWLAICPDPSALLGIAVPATVHRPGAELLAIRDEYFAPVQGHYYADPPQIERGWRHLMFDTVGRQYIDMVNNVAVLGHGDPRLADAVKSQLLRLNTNSRFHYEALAQFVEDLVARTPDPLDTVLLVNSGSEAVDLAIRLAQAATGRRDMVSITEAYHGWTTGSDGVSSSVADNPAALETRPEWVHLVAAPHRGPANRRSSGSTLDQTLTELQMLEDRSVRIAGFISEPVFGNGGGMLLPNGYLEGVWGAIRSRGGICISDEVQVGYGRLGSHFWGFEQQGVVPDIVTMAKAMGNGHPLGAVITTREIAAALASLGSFFSSAAGSPVSCVVGSTVLRILISDELQENAVRMGDYLSHRLGELIEASPRLGQLHGLGLYRGLEIVDSADSARADAVGAKRICDELLPAGIIMQRTGDLGNVLKIKPPLTIDRPAIDHFVDSLDRVLRLETARAGVQLSVSGR